MKEFISICVFNEPLAKRLKLFYSNEIMEFYGTRKDFASLISLEPYEDFVLLRVVPHKDIADPKAWHMKLPDDLPSWWNRGYRKLAYDFAIAEIVKQVKYVNGKITYYPGCIHNELYDVCDWNNLVGAHSIDVDLSDDGTKTPFPELQYVEEDLKLTCDYDIWLSVRIVGGTLNLKNVSHIYTPCLTAAGSICASRGNLSAVKLQYCNTIKMASRSSIHAGSLTELENLHIDNSKVSLPMLHSITGQLYIDAVDVLDAPHLKFAEEVVTLRYLSYALNIRQVYTLQCYNTLPFQHLVKAETIYVPEDNAKLPNLVACEELFITAPTARAYGLRYYGFNKKKYIKKNFPLLQGNNIKRLK